MQYTWTFGICETCLKNSHEQVKMVRQKIFSGDVEGKHSEVFFVCPVCGSTKRL